MMKLTHFFLYDKIANEVKVEGEIVPDELCLQSRVS